MARDTLSETAAIADMDEDAGPSSPSPPTASVDGLQEDYERFTFLQSVIQKGFMPEKESRDMYMQLTDSDTGGQPICKTQICCRFCSFHD